MGKISTYLYRSATKAAQSRKQVYGLDTPPVIKHLLELDPEHLGSLGCARLSAYLYIEGAALRIRRVRNYLIDRDTPSRRERIERLRSALLDELSPGCRVCTGYFERRLSSRDVAVIPSFLETFLFRTTPHLSVQVRTEGDIVRTLRFANDQRLPVVPRGAGSFPLGGAVPTANGIVLDLSRMNRILHIDSGAQTASVEPGVRWGDLAESLKAEGLELLTTPSSRFSTVGGWASTGGLGHNGYKHGSFHNTLVGADVVLADGQKLTLESDRPELKLLLGSEGQLGIFSSLQLNVQPLSSFEQLELLQFDSVEAAMDCAARIGEAGVQPAHMMLMDRDRLVEENLAFFDRTPHTRPVVDERDSLLLRFDSENEAERFTALCSDEEWTRAAGAAARYLWAERYFPLKAQRFGPNLLAAEYVVSPEKVAACCADAKAVGQRFGLTIGVEASVYRIDGELKCVVIASYTTDASRLIEYCLSLLVVQLLLRRAIAKGAKIYAVGIWNTPLIKDYADSAELKELKKAKERFDPWGRLNPGKFFAVRSRLKSITGLAFTPLLFRSMITAAAALSPVLGWVSRISRSKAAHKWHVPKAEEGDGIPLLEETAERCTYCGSCVSVCPAYVITGDELVTGRAKLRLATALLQSTPVEEREAFANFQCIRCGLCEEVCQTRLPLRDCYEQLEHMAARRFGRYPHEVVEPFINKVDENRDWVLETFGLDAAPWAPANMTEKLPGSRKIRGGSL